MSENYSEDETVAAVARLTRRRLAAFAEAGAVRPARGTTGNVYARVDIARLELLCDLTDCYDLGDDGLRLVLSLVDQLHSARADLLAVVEAVAAEPPDVRHRIGAALTRRPR